jgi:hypothetical protein
MRVPVSPIQSDIPNNPITDKCAPFGLKIYRLTAEKRFPFFHIALAGNIFLSPEYKSNKDFVFDRFYKYRP